VAFAREAAVLGIPRDAIRGDVTDLWYGSLSLRWRERPEATAGLTREDSLFCLEQLARDHRMRVVFRESRGELVSWVIAPMDVGRDSSRRRARWPDKSGPTAGHREDRT
jgi:hypothetical protein